MPAKRKWFGWSAIALVGILSVASSACKDRRLLEGTASTTTTRTAVTQPATVSTRATTASTVSQAPSGGTYIVQDGDTLFDISQSTGVSVAAILAANNLSEQSFIIPGQKLIIPGSGGAVDTPTPAPTVTTLPEGTETSIVTVTIVVTVPKTTAG